MSTPSQQALGLLKAELCDIQDGLKRRPHGPERQVFQEMAGDLQADIRAIEKELRRCGYPKKAEGQ